MQSYIPQKGDFIILTFDPQSGHEQKGRRPAIVTSNYLFRGWDKISYPFKSHKSQFINIEKF